MVCSGLGDSGCVVVRSFFVLLWVAVDLAAPLAFVPCEVFVEVFLEAK